MKIIVCPDSFKGSMNAVKVSNIIADTLLEFDQNIEIVKIPLADGGEGTGELLKENCFPVVKELYAHDPLGRLIKTQYYLNHNTKKAFIESAEIIGLTLLKPEERNPLKTSSFGLGEVIKDAINSGFKDITVSLGGTATCDGGIGMASALGYRFLDENLKELEGNGRNLLKITAIDTWNKYKLKNIKFTVICDVDNPLTGELGTANIFAKQKGAEDSDIPFLEAGMENLDLCCITAKLSRNNHIFKKGSGAAGGLGYAFLSFLNAENNFYSGIEYILKTLKFKDLIKNADLIITGEGKIDRQSLMGKVVSGVLKISKELNIPLIAFAGKVENKDVLIEAGIKEIFEISDKALSLVQNMNEDKTKDNLEKTVKILLNSNIFKHLAN